MDQQGATASEPGEDSDAAASSAAAGATQPTTATAAAGARQAAGAAGESTPITRSQAEKVIGRALELADQDLRQHGSDPPLTVADVTDIARQLGLDPALVVRALREVRTTSTREAPATRTQRVIGPPRVTRTAVVSADATLVRTSAVEWMTQDEGMVRTGTRGDTDRWVRDKRILVSLRRGLHADRGSGALRDLKGVSITLTPDAEGSVVAIEADTTSVQATGLGIAAGGAVLSVLLGAGAAAIVPDSAVLGSDAAQFAAGFVPAIVATAGTAVVVTRTWVRAVRDGIEQALDGIAMTSVEPRLHPPESREGSWRQTAARWLGGGG